MTASHPLRRVLNTTYRRSGYLGVVFLVLILVLVAAQMITRWIGVVFVGGPDYTGYCMAAASFLALPYALNAGTHIRVNLLLNALGRYRRLGEIWCWLVASALTSIWAYYAVKLTWESHRWNEVSQGQDAWPLWIPQIPMSFGMILLAVAAIDNLVTILWAGKDNITPISDLQSE